MCLQRVSRFRLSMFVMSYSSRPLQVEDYLNVAVTSDSAAMSPEIVSKAEKTKMQSIEGGIELVQNGCYIADTHF